MNEFVALANAVDADHFLVAQIIRRIDRLVAILLLAFTQSLLFIYRCQYCYQCRTQMLHPVLLPLGSCCFLLECPEKSRKITVSIIH